MVIEPRTNVISRYYPPSLNSRGTRLSRRAPHTAFMGTLDPLKWPAALEQHLVAVEQSRYLETMKHKALKVVRLGRSRGVRLSAGLLRRHGIGDTVVMEEHPEGILLRPAGATVRTLSWRQTARAMAASHEDWRAWDIVCADGLSESWTRA